LCPEGFLFGGAGRLATWAFRGIREMMAYKSRFHPVGKRSRHGGGNRSAGSKSSHPSPCSAWFSIAPLQRMLGPETLHPARELAPGQRAARVSLGFQLAKDRESLFLINRTGQRKAVARQKRRSDLREGEWRCRSPSWPSRRRGEGKRAPVGAFLAMFWVLAMVGGPVGSPAADGDLRTRRGWGSL